MSGGPVPQNGQDGFSRAGANANRNRFQQPVRRQRQPIRMVQFRLEPRSHALQGRKHFF